jgi:hypothetical protein
MKHRHLLCFAMLGGLVLGCANKEPKEVASVDWANVPNSKLSVKFPGIPDPPDAESPKKNTPDEKKKTDEEALASITGTEAKEGGWGTIKGKIVFDGAKAPERTPLKVEKDQDHCLKNGPLHDEAWVVNPNSKGIRWVVVFLKEDPKKKLPVHDQLKAPQGDAVLDQPQCAFVPHVLAMRSDQKLLVKNPAPIVHTATFKGFSNDTNLTLQPGENKQFTVVPEKNAITLSCAVHPWMRGWLWVFEHPYFAVTDEEGNFEIKFAPSGTQRLVIWQESLGYLGGRAGRDGREIQVQPEGVTDLGAIKMKPAE